MNLYLRLIWAMFRAWRQPRIVPGESITRHLRVWPNDIDINGHMNNGRYLTLIDLMIIEYFVRTGFAQAMIQSGWRPMSGGSFVTYRKGLKPLERYQLIFQLDCADEHWNYMRYEFRRLDGSLCAAGYMKGAAVGRQGLVPNAVSYAKGGQTFTPSPLLPHVAQWVSAESGLMQSLK
ncbi:MAG: thioesterase family protein [Brachymonas sp.]